MHTISELVSSVAHDMKNRMATIGNCVESIERRVSGSHDIQRECDAIRRAARAASERLLGLNMMVNPRWPQREIVSMRSTVSRFTSGINGTDLSVSLPSNEVFISADTLQMLFVFDILLANSKWAMAIQHNTANQPAQASIELTVRATDGEVQLLWRDHGCGMSPETTARCFEPFFTTGRSKIGLGLFAARRIVEAHRGRISVESNEGKGACFTIALPRHTLVAESA